MERLAGAEKPSFSRGQVASKDKDRDSYPGRKGSYRPWSYCHENVSAGKSAQGKRPDDSLVRHVQTSQMVSAPYASLTAQVVRGAWAEPGFGSPPSKLSVAGKNTLPVHYSLAEQYRLS